MQTTVIKKSIRVVVYELKDGRNEVFIIGSDPEAERHERASAEREMRNPESHIIGFHFEWREEDCGNGRHSWYE
jgi:hypothetical protein